MVIPFKSEIHQRMIALQADMVELLEEALGGAEDRSVFMDVKLPPHQAVPSLTVREAMFSNSLGLWYADQLPKDRISQLTGIKAK